MNGIGAVCEDEQWITPSTTEPAPESWTVETLNEALVPAAEAWLQSGFRSDSPEALALMAAFDSVHEDGRLIGDDLYRSGPFSASHYVAEATSAGWEDLGLEPRLPPVTGLTSLEGLNLYLPSLPVLLHPGTYTVGEPLQPGTYQTVSGVDGCYWETLDAAGEINDNNFVSSAPQVQMTVRPDDFAVHVDSECGLWFML